MTRRVGKMRLNKSDKNIELEVSEIFGTEEIRTELKKRKGNS